MTRRALGSLAVGLLMFGLTVVAVGLPASGQAPKRGGILNSLLTEDPPGLLIHESATVSNVWPMAPCYSNVVLFHPLKSLESVDTGPFRFKKYERGQMVELERNPDYFVPGRPYLDGIRYTIIGERGTRLAALQAGRLDAFVPLDVTKTMAESLKKSAPSLVITEVGQNGSDNVILNHKRPPFDNASVRRAISLAMDRHAFVQGVRHGGAVVGAAMMPKPFGIWGLPEQEYGGLPGYGNPGQNKAEAKRLLAAAGYGPGKPLRVE